MGNPPTFSTFFSVASIDLVLENVEHECFGGTCFSCYIQSVISIYLFLYTARQIYKYFSLDLIPRLLRTYEMLITHSLIGYLFNVLNIYQSWLLEYLERMGLDHHILQLSISLSKSVHLLTHSFQAILTSKRSFSSCVVFFKQLNF